MLSKKISHRILMTVWIIVAAVYFALRIFAHYWQEFEFKYARYNPEIRAYFAQMYLDGYLSPSWNPISGPTVIPFMDLSRVTAMDDVPQVPDLFGKFGYLLRGYKVGDHTTYVSPWLTEEKLPKALIEHTIKTPPYSDISNPHYWCFAKRKQQHDTVYFRATLVDLTLRDSLLPQIIERALRYGLLEYNFYPNLPGYGHPFYLEASRNGKVLYQTSAFDSTEVKLCWDTANEKEFEYGGLRFRMYSQYTTIDRHKNYVTRVWKYEWELLLLFTLALVMLLRGDTVREIVVGWWKKRK